MSNYEPVNLASYCNAGVDILGEQSRRVPVGMQTFHGLPFLIGEAGCAFLAFGAQGYSRPLTIPLNAQAENVIFAHRLLESKLDENGPLGLPVADYVFHYSDGSSERAVIRERFEISIIPHPWGVIPFLAYPDQKDGLMPRYEGQWYLAGSRQTESIQSWPKGYYLWAWRNPHPERTIESLEIVPHEMAFLIGAITLGHVDEHPFTRVAGRATTMEFTQPEDATSTFNVEVEVDRGWATYPYQLPVQDADSFIADPYRGFGEPQNESASPIYTEISAIPSATVTVKQNGEEVASFNWGEAQKQEGGKIEVSPRLAVTIVDPGRNWVHTRVVDDETGEPLPCRIHFRSPEGIPYAPHGHHAHVNSNNKTWHIDVGGDLRLGQISYAYTGGTCQGWLPRGDVIVDVAHGFEYEPLRTRVRIEPGQQQLELRMKRIANLNRERWYSGDTHVHFLSTQGSHTEAQGEDLHVVNLLLSQWGSLFTNSEEFTGEPSIARNGRSIVYATQENRQHLLGHITLLGLKQPVMPWCSDGPSEAEMGSTLEVTLSDWADQTHAQGGTVIIPHLPNPNGEPATLIATGRADGVEMIRYGKFEHGEYYRYLNCGYKLPLVGGTDKMTSDVPVGLYRTYVSIPQDEEFTYDNWCKNLSRGRTFLSGGPLIRFSVDGHSVGDTINLPGNGGTVEVEASVDSVLPVHTLQIVQEGRVVAQVDDPKGTKHLHLKTSLKLDHHTWLAARAGGPKYYNVLPHHDCWSRGIFAHTSPVYVAVGGEWWMFDQDTAQYMLTLIDGSLSYIRHRSNQFEHANVMHHHGESDHMAYLERPFQQAREALHKRMHDLGIPH